MELRRADLGKHPLWHSNQGAFWMCFKMAGVGESIPGYGRLMREPRYRTAEERERRLMAV